MKAISSTLSSSEHLVDPEPDNRSAADADRLGDVATEGGALEKREEENVPSEAEARAVDHRAPVALQVRLANVVEGCAVEVAKRKSVIEHDREKRFFEIIRPSTDIPHAQNQCADGGFG